MGLLLFLGLVEPWRTFVVQGLMFLTGTREVEILPFILAGLVFFGGLILLFVVVPIIAVIVLAKRGKIVPAAAGLGLLQGLAKIGFALFGASERHVPQGQPVASVAVSLMLIQGPVLIIFAVATYRGKLWGASGLLIIAILSALVSLVEGVKAVWLIPITLTYALAVGSRVRDTSGNVLMTRHRPRSSHCRQPNMALERTAGTARRG